MEGSYLIIMQVSKSYEIGPPEPLAYAPNNVIAGLSAPIVCSFPGP